MRYLPPPLTPVSGLVLPPADMSRLCSGLTFGLSGPPGAGAGAGAGAGGEDKDKEESGAATAGGVDASGSLGRALIQGVCSQVAVRLSGL